MYGKSPRSHIRFTGKGWVLISLRALNFALLIASAEFRGRDVTCLEWKISPLCPLAEKSRSLLCKNFSLLKKYLNPTVIQHTLFLTSELINSVITFSCWLTRSVVGAKNTIFIFFCSAKQNIPVFSTWQDENLHVAHNDRKTRIKSLL